MRLCNSLPLARQARGYDKARMRLCDSLVSRARDGERASASKRAPNTPRLNAKAHKHMYNSRPPKRPKNSPKTVYTIPLYGTCKAPYVSPFEQWHYRPPIPFTASNRASCHNRNSAQSPKTVKKLVKATAGMSVTNIFPYPYLTYAKQWGKISVVSGWY